MKPKRVQRKRTKGWRMPSNTVSVARPSKFGNPYAVEYDKRAEKWAIREIAQRYGYYMRKYGTREEALSGCLKKYRWHALMHLDLSQVRGKNLACWCPLDQPCHADVLLELANKKKEARP